uniref:Uncharacterized protein n=1 Tax=Trieres chinensis TaxID=1514140 RepID=A0A7S1Z8N5_TRICV
MAKLQASVDDRILTSDFESVFRNGGRLPSSSEDIFFAFDERPPGAPFEYRFRLDAVETGASSVSPVDFFGTDDLPKVQRWLQELNSEVELLRRPGCRSRTSAHGIPTWAFLLPLICCLGGVCFLVSEEQKFRDSVLDVVEDRLARPPAGYCACIRRACRHVRVSRNGGTSSGSPLETQIWLELRKTSSNAK